MSYLNKYIPQNFYEINADKQRVQTPLEVQRLRNAYKKEKSRKVIVLDPVSRQLIKIPVNSDLNVKYKKAEQLINNIKVKINEIKNKKQNQKKQKKQKKKKTRKNITVSNKQKK